MTQKYHDRGQETFWKIDQSEKKRMAASAFSEWDTICFSMSVPRCYGYIEPVMHIVGDTLAGDERQWYFKMEWNGFDGTLDSYSVTIPMRSLLDTAAHDGLFFYHYILADGIYYATGENGDFSQQDGDFRKNQFLITRADATSPEWIRHGIIYHIFVDRFCRSGRVKTQKPGTVLHQNWDGELMEFAPKRGAPVKNNDFFGGDLWGIAEKIEDIAALGAGAIYLSPIFDAASNHKYDTGDYEAVDAMFGGDAALDHLIAVAHKHGIRVILDGVFNHTGDDSKYFNRYGTYPLSGAYQSKASPYFPWYTFRHYPDKYDCWWGIPILPRVNCEEASYSDYICRVVQDWTKKGIGGWRLDVADELTDAFIEKLRCSIRAANADAVLYGEVWENATNKLSYGVRRRYLRGGNLDSVMNYPLREAIIRYLTSGDADAMIHVAADIYGRYPAFATNCLMNFLGTHDTERILTVLGDENPGDAPPAALAYRMLSPEKRQLGLLRLRLAYLILTGMPGVPCVFYGDEAGMEGYHDPFNRRPYPWNRIDSSLRDYYRMLGAFRRDNSVLMDGDFTLVQCDRDLLLFARSLGTETLLFCINRSHRHYVVRAGSANLPLAPLFGDILPMQTTKLGGIRTEVLS